MTTRSPQQLVLKTAAAEIGYNRHADKARGTKYARETQPVFWPRDSWLLANGISYCDIFVTWVFWKALGKDFVTSGALPAGASYNTDYRASKGGRVSKPPKPGDVLVFDWNPRTAATNHVGILEKVLPSGNYQTIEGNTAVGASGSQSNGGRVARRVRRPDQVKYVIRPEWNKAPLVGVSTGGAGVPTAAKPAAKPSVSKAPAFPLPRKPGAMYFYGRGKEKTAVTGMQRNTGVPGDVVQVGGRWRSKGLALFQARLIARGWSELARNGGADGRFGATTEKVVGQFQKSMGLPVDHKIGPGTWAAAWTEPVK